MVFFSSNQYLISGEKRWDTQILEVVNSDSRNNKIKLNAFMKKVFFSPRDANGYKEVVVVLQNSWEECPYKKLKIFNTKNKLMMTTRLISSRA